MQILTKKEIENCTGVKERRVRKKHLLNFTVFFYFYWFLLRFTTSIEINFQPSIQLSHLMLSIWSNHFPLQPKTLLINGGVLGFTGILFNVLIIEFTLVKISWRLEIVKWPILGYFDKSLSDCLLFCFNNFCCFSITWKCLQKF